MGYGSYRYSITDLLLLRLPVGLLAIRPIQSGFKAKHPMETLTESLLSCFETHILCLRYLNTPIKKFRYIIAVILATVRFLHRLNQRLTNKLQTVTA